MKKQTYKLRAECLHDVNVFIEKLGRHSWGAIESYRVEFLRFDDGKRMPDCELEFVSGLTLKTILKLLSKIEDGHVMLETVQTLKKYTGERQ